MSPAFVALGLLLHAALPAEAPVAPRLASGLSLTQAWPGARAERTLFTLDDAPTSQLSAFSASALTSLTGMVALMGLMVGPAESAPLGPFVFQSRLAVSLLLLSVGPSVGDLLNQDARGFALGAGGRSLLVAASWGSVLLMTQPRPEPLVVVSGILFVTFAALAWTGWSTVDLFRSFLAPERWVERKNEELRRRPPTMMRHAAEGPQVFTF